MGQFPSLNRWHTNRIEAERMVVRCRAKKHGGALFPTKMILSSIGKIGGFELSILCVCVPERECLRQRNDWAKAKHNRHHHRTGKCVKRSPLFGIKWDWENWEIGKSLACNRYLTKSYRCSLWTDATPHSNQTFNHIQTSRLGYLRWIAIFLFPHRWNMLQFFRFAWVCSLIVQRKCFSFYFKCSLSDCKSLWEERTLLHIYFPQ